MNFSLMRKQDGSIKKVVAGSTREASMGYRRSHRSYVCLCLIPFLSGCAALKKTALIAGVSSIGAGVGSVLSGSVGAVAGAATGATAGVVATGLGGSEKVSGQPLAVTAETVVQEAPANFWSLLGELVSMGGWALILIVLVPMVFSWLMPGPIQFKGKKK